MSESAQLMPAAAPLTPDPRILAANLAALRRRDPALAESLARLADPLAGVMPAMTRDGLPSFRIHLASPDGRDRCAWFGRTSVPGVRAAALLEQFDAGQGNVLLPGIAQGAEATLLLDRLGRHRAVFVWEPQPRDLLLALHLHLWSEAIADQRLVFLVCPREELSETLAHWLAEHPGHLCPERIMIWPWLHFADLADIRHEIQAAHGQVESQRAVEQAQQRSRIAEWGRSAASGGQRVGPGGHVAVLSLHAQEETCELNDLLSEAVAAAGFHAVGVAVRGPGDMHPVARLRRLIDACPAGPDVAILLDITRHEAEEMLPGSTPAVCWLSAKARIDQSLPSRLGPSDALVVTNTRLKRILARLGVPESRLAVCAHPCLAGADATNEPSSPVERPIDVAVVADLSPAVPAAYGFTLPTHEQIWNTAIELLKARVETFESDQGESILKRAEAKAGTALDDADLRERMVHALSVNAANGLLWRFLVQAIVQAGVTVTAFGQGWGDLAGVRWHGPAPRFADRRCAARQAKLFIHADVTGDCSGLTLAAASCGAVLVARSHTLDSQAGGLTTLLEPGREMAGFRTARELAAVVGQLLRDGPARLRLVEQAVRRCRTDHDGPACWRRLTAAATSLFGPGAGQH